MDETTFDRMARDELDLVEAWFDDVDPDDVEITTSDGVLTLFLRDGARVVINSHRAAGQIWMAAVATAWHFDYQAGDGRWHDSKTGAELRETLSGVIRDHLALTVPG